MSEKLRIRKLRICTIVAVTAILLTVLCILIFTAPPKLVISEVCAVNDGKFPAASETDKKGALCDWIELYNPTKHAVSLKRYTLCRDDEAECAISGGKIPAGGYVLVYCSKKGFADDSVPSVDFKIPKAESCTITLKSGLRTIDAITTEPTSKGSTVCAGKGGAYITTPTPCAANAEDARASQVTFSAESGYCPKPFLLELSAANSASIYYTLDGTDPRTSSTAKLYTSAIDVKDRRGEKNVLSAEDPMKIQLEYRKGKVEAPEDENVDKGTVVRACAKSSDGEWGHVSTATYMVGLSPADHSGLPMISLVTAPAALYAHETGIYTRGKVYEDYYPTEPDHLYNGSIPANYNQKGRDWERECTLQFFESDGTLQFTQDAGMRIQGGWSRADYQKSFRFYARSTYGKDTFDYPFWQELTDSDGQPADSFKTFVLRNGGNDSNFLKYKDIMVQDMASCLSPATQTGRACVLFIDGEYWGLYTLQEDYSQEYFARHYDVDSDTVAIYKNGTLDEGLAVDELSFKNMQSFIIGNDMSKAENYARVCELLDMENFIDYCAAEMYIFNDDWPQNNYGCWRSRELDSKWRFFFFDTESCACHYNMNNAELDYFEYLHSKSYKPMVKMILSLLKNDDFRSKLITRIMDMSNIVFTEERVSEYQQRYSDIYLPEMEAYYLRFPTHRTVEGSSKPMIRRMTDFFAARQPRIIADLSAQFSLTAPKKITVKGGGAKLNGLEISDGFSGKYFAGSELTFTAADDAKWQVTTGGKSAEYDGTLTLKVTADTEIKLIN